MHRARGAIVGVVFGALLVGSTAASAQEPADKGQVELASALAARHVSLTLGLTNAVAKGKPISAKYEYEDGKLQLSVYTERAGQLVEVVVDHCSGKVAKAEQHVTPFWCASGACLTT